MSFIKKYSGFILIILLSFFSIQPLFTPGFFPIHDDTQVARVFEMKTALADGMFPVRWVPDLGYNYGYPIFNFYGPLAYYIGGFFNLLGFDSLISTKIMIGLAMILSGVFMYLLAKEFWGKLGGIVSAVLYVYAPYHALNLYVRGAIGELWAYAFVPLAFLGIYKVYTSSHSSAENIALKSKVKNQKSKIKSQKFLWVWMTLAAFGYAGIIVSHNLTAMMVTPFLFVFAVLLYVIAKNNKDASKEYFVLLGLLLGIFLAAFYWLPALLEMKYTNVLSVVGGGSDYNNHFACLSQLWNSEWGFGGSTAGCVDGLSFKIGKLHILLGLLAIIPLIFIRAQKQLGGVIIISYLFLLVSVFLTLSYSKFIWDALPQMAFFQFPWRFLLLITFFISFLGGALFLLFDKNFDFTSRHSGQARMTINALLSATVIFGIIFLNVKLFTPDKVSNKTSEDYTNKSEIIWKTSKISDEYMPPGFKKPRSLEETPKRKMSETEGVKLLSYSEKTQVISAELAVPKKTDVLFNLAYVPGWHVYIDNKQESFKHFNKGIFVTVPEGKHTVEIRFSQTPIEQVGNALSLTGVFILLAGIIYSRNQRYEYKKT